MSLSYHGYKTFELFVFALLFIFTLLALNQLFLSLRKTCTDLFALTCLAFSLMLIKRKKMLGYMRKLSSETESTDAHFPIILIRKKNNKKKNKALDLII